MNNENRYQDLNIDDISEELIDEHFAEKKPEPLPEGKRTEAQVRASKKFYRNNREGELTRTKRYQQGLDDPSTRERYLENKKRYYREVELPRRRRRAAEAKAAREAAANGVE